ncbi:MAG: hypothetical protein AABW50_04565 [Nanoarchaeota archaeon]
MRLKNKPFGKVSKPYLCQEPFKKRFPKSLVIFVSLLFGIFLVNFASSLQYDCEFRALSQCQVAPWNNIIFKASDATNAHGAVWNGAGNYQYVLCCNFPGARPASCDADIDPVDGFPDDKVLILSSSTNAHAAVSDLPSSYSTDVCYENVTCIHTTQGCNSDYPIEAFSLSDLTNAHIANQSIYSTDVCCINNREVTNNCVGLGGTACNPSTPAPLCNGGSWGAANDAQYCCVGGSCCNPNSQATTCANFITNNPFYASWECTTSPAGVTTTNNCGQTVVCIDNICPNAGEVCDPAQSHQCIAPSVCGDASCNGGENCITCSQDCGTCPAGCFLAGATWEQKTALAGQNIWMNVTGTSSCIGDNIEFKIYDNSNDNLITTLTASFVSISGKNYSRVNWTALYNGGANNISTYYFIAREPGNQEANSEAGAPFPYLNVSSTSMSDIQRCSQYTPFGQQICINDYANAANNISASCTDASCPWSCSCVWDGNSCEDNYVTTFCNGGNISNIGMCTSNTEGITDCTEGLGIYTITWDGIWGWDFTNIEYNDEATCEATEGGNCVLDNNNWYFDPNNESTSCTSGGQNIFECPAEIQLPFFNFYNTIAVIGLIFAGYFIMRKKDKK